MSDQRSTFDQVLDLHRIAIERGMYDAADWIVSHWPAITFDTPEAKDRGV